MDRRAFFRSALDKGSKPVIKVIDHHIEQQARHWIRPPFAIGETDFILTCTRCGDCIEACPHNVIFPLPARLGVRFAATPALDLLNKGCHLCDDWPCVNVCPTRALRITTCETNDQDKQPSGTSTSPAQQTRPPISPPKLANTTIDTHSCLPYNGPECGACLASCPVQGALRLEQCRPVIDANLCCGCAMCREHCITEPAAIHITT